VTSLKLGFTGDQIVEALQPELRRRMAANGHTSGSWTITHTLWDVRQDAKRVDIVFTLTKEESGD
jgi:hypothetical protein